LYFVFDHKGRENKEMWLFQLFCWEKGGGNNFKIVIFKNQRNGDKNYVKFRCICAKTNSSKDKNYSVNMTFYYRLGIMIPELRLRNHIFKMWRSFLEASS
jgi:hypothetical protein